MRLYLAAREAAHHRLYAGVPWLRDRVVALIADYAKAISVDFSAVEQLASSIDPNDPASIEAALGQGMFEPTITPGQQAAMARAGDAARAGRGLGGHRRRRGGRRPAARRGSAARDAAPPPGHRRPGRADLRHPDRPGAAAAPAARRRGPVAGDRRRPRHRRPGRAVGAPRPAAVRRRTWTIPPASSTGTSSSPSCSPAWTTSSRICRTRPRPTERPTATDAPTDRRADRQGRRRPTATDDRDPDRRGPPPAPRAGLIRPVRLRRSWTGSRG